MKIMTVDIGGTSIKYGLSDEDAYISQKGSFKTPKTLEELYAGIEDVYHTFGDPDGIAMSCPGAVDSDTGIIGGSSALPYIHGPNIKKDLETRLHTIVEMENDANCAALAEVWKGAAKETNDSCFVVSGTGVGGAVIKDRKIHKGIHLHGGEFGYMIQDYDLETLTFKTWSHFSTVAIVKNVAQELGVDPESIHGTDIFNQANENPVYKKYVDQFYFNLAMGIYNIQYAYDPEIIVIGGGISARDDLVEQVNEKLDLILAHLPDAKIKPVITKCHFMNDANMIGALYHFMCRVMP